MRAADKPKRIAADLPLRVFHCLPIPGELKALAKTLDKFGVGWERIPSAEGDTTVAFRVWGHTDALERIGRLRFVRVRDADKRLLPSAMPEECPGGNRPAVARMREKRTIRIR